MLVLASVGVACSFLSETAMCRECHSAPSETGPSSKLGAIHRRVPGLDEEAVAGVVGL